jgi:FkbM family methyltransferase
MTEIELISKLLPENKETRLVFFDVGANSFSFGLYAKQIYPNATVYGFEADTAVFKSTARNRQINESYELHYLNKAVADVNGVAKFYPSLSYSGKEHRSSGSLCEPVIDSATNKMLRGYTSLEFDPEGYEVPTVRLDTFCSDKKINQIDYLHIDVQGAEDKVIRGLGKLRPTYIYAETNLFGEALYKTTTTLSKFDELLEDYGYQIFDRTHSDTMYLRTKS